MPSLRSALAYIPTPGQELLLKAALLGDGPALEAWRQWLQFGDLDELDPGSHRLLPLLYRNLVKLGIEYPHLERLKGVLRLTFYRNQTLIHHGLSALRSLQDAGIRMVLLKGAGLLAQGAYEFGDRPMGDFDVLVPASDAHAAFEQLGAAGWLPEARSVEKEIIYAHAAALRSSLGLALDLHWHAFANRRADAIDQEFWSRTRAVDFGGIAAAIFDPTDQLIHVCVHGARYNSVPTIRWVADSLAIARLADPLDWERVLRLAGSYSLSLPLADTLGYLQSNFDLAVPADILDALRTLPVDRRRRREYRVLARPNPAFDNLAAYWYGFLRSRMDPVTLRDVLAFPEYLKLAWKKENLWQVIGQLIAWPLRRASSWLKATLLRFPLIGPVYARIRAKRSP